MKRRSLLKLFALSTGNIALPLPLLGTEGTLNLLPEKKFPVFAKTVKEIPGATEFAFTVDKGSRYKHFFLDSPNRLVIDFYNAGIFGIDTLKRFSNDFILKVRVGHPGKTTARVVFDLGEEARMTVNAVKGPLVTHLKVHISKVRQDTPTSQKTLPPKEESGSLQVEAEAEEALQSRESDTQKLEVSRREVQSPELQKREMEYALDETRDPVVSQQLKGPNRSLKIRDKIIVIDPGHGGIDPGTIGAEGTREKDVVLAVAKRVEERLNQIEGYQAILTRNDDRYLSLKKRVAIVQECQAHLSLSLHVDAFHDSSIRGASVYCLNENSSLPIDPRAQELSNKENGGRGVFDFDLANSMDHSLEWFQKDIIHRLTLSNARIFGKNLIHSMEKNQAIDLQYNRVKRADFFILKTPATPSALVEMAFLSNAFDEQLIQDEIYQDHFSLALTQGVSRYLHHA
jgi:N-acetylmuramoyl-L-alanine amidase